MGAEREAVALSAQQRLTLSREAIEQQLERRRRKPAANVPLEPQAGLLARVRRTASVWWHSHPANEALAFARPALQDYARQRPYQMLGIAAGTGVALAVLRAWRLMPLTGLVLALMKSSDVKATVRSLATPATGTLRRRPRMDRSAVP